MQSLYTLIIIEISRQSIAVLSIGLVLSVILLLWLEKRSDKKIFQITDKGSIVYTLPGAKDRLNSTIYIKNTHEGQYKIICTNSDILKFPAGEADEIILKTKGDFIELKADRTKNLDGSYCYFWEVLNLHNSQEV